MSDPSETLTSMGGGMNKRGSFGSMADRVAGSGSRAGPPTATPAIKHCWVTTRHGRLPGLLLEWRSVDGVWRGRVVHPVPEEQNWVVLEEWLPAGLLDPA